MDAKITTFELGVTPELGRVLEDISRETGLSLEEILSRALAYGVAKAFKE